MSADDILDQADALMRRHRSFVARVPGDMLDEAPGTEDAEESDIPLLTEVVDVSDVGPLDIEALIAVLRQEMDEALSDWLVDVLPVAVANASQQILAELDAKARHTLLPRLQEILSAHAGQAAEPDGATADDADTRDDESPSV